MPILDPRNEEAVRRYDAFVRSSPYGNLMQDRGWAAVKKGWDGEQVTLEENGEIVAALSILFAPAVGGRVLAYAPRGPVCDPRDLAAVRGLCREAEPLLRKRRAFVLRLDPETPYDVALLDAFRREGFRVRSRNVGMRDPIQPRFNFFLPLRGRPFDELMTAFSEKTRYNVRLSARKGVAVRHSRTAEDLGAFFGLYLVTCARDGIGHRPLDYFERMLGAYPSSRVYLAELDGAALAGAIAVRYGRKVFYIYGASGNERRNTMPAYAVQAAMIRWAVETGADFYDLGGVWELTKENGLYRFKEGFCRETGVTELLGEADLVLDPFWYRVFVTGKPLLQKARKLLRRPG